MKKNLTSLLLIVMLATFQNYVLAQAPNQFSYQAIVKNAANEYLINLPVGIKISVLQGSASGTTVYSESHTVTSNANGLVTLAIGTGSLISGNFNTINWGAGVYFIKVETDPGGGSNYSLSTTQQLLSVPYALHSSTSGDNKWSTSSGTHIYNTGLGNVGIGIATPKNLLDLGNSLVNRKIALYTDFNNDHQFNGFGINPAVMRYQVSQTSGNHVFYAGTSSTTSNELLRISGTGNIGIGKTNPSAALDFANVLDNRRIALYTDADNDHQFTGFGVNAFVTRYQISDTDNHHVFYAATSSTSSNELFRISGTGKIGVGKSSPKAFLDFGNVSTNRKIALWTDSDNDHQFHGFGVNSFVLRYQIPTTSNNHVFYAGTSATTSNELMRITGTGNVCIGTSTPATGYKLTVDGKIICEELRVQLSPFPDYVFEPAYRLAPLNEVEAFIQTNKHLPGMPSAKEVETESVNVGEIELKLVEKVEELTLHLIAQQKEIEKLKQTLTHFTNK